MTEKFSLIRRPLSEKEKYNREAAEKVSKHLIIEIC